MIWKKYIYASLLFKSCVNSSYSHGMLFYTWGNLFLYTNAKFNLKVYIWIKNCMKKSATKKRDFYLNSEKSHLRIDKLKNIANTIFISNNNYWYKTITENKLCAHYLKLNMRKLTMTKSDLKNKRNWKWTYGVIVSSINNENIMYRFITTKRRSKIEDLKKQNNENVAVIDSYPRWNLQRVVVENESVDERASSPLKFTGKSKGL